ncbi:MAG: 16S rRNA (guanine(966)-N(2))-methyltransferase RsmD [Actinomycetota bacterium]|nr:16S rRNA (guanine(966)-N(2))-methyltransferase RsmD [Actinomycetota bacterium]
MRPTADRVKESVFSALGPRLASARVLDLYAGTGALAVEALSRGAAVAVLVERDREALAAIAANLETTGVAPARVVRGDVATVLGGPSPPEGPFDLVLADPPYELDDDAVGEVLMRLVAPGWLAPGAVVVLERPAGAVRPPGWVSTWDRCYGDTLVWFLQAE